eukprot:10577433-Alexandrium_andersonii.AAC.1
MCKATIRLHWRARSIEDLRWAIAKWRTGVAPTTDGATHVHALKAAMHLVKIAPAVRKALRDDKHKWVVALS